MISGSSKKVAIKYKDRKGIVRVKNCGNAHSTRECITWLKRMGYQFISRQNVSANDNELNLKPRRMKSCVKTRK